MLVEKIKELTGDLRRIHLDLKSMQNEMRIPDTSDGREIDIDKVIDDLNSFKLNVMYLRLKATELAQTRELDFKEVRDEVRYFVTYLKNAGDTFNEIVNSLTYGGRSGDEAAIQKTGEEILILQRHLEDMNAHLSVINTKLGKNS